MQQCLFQSKMPHSCQMEELLLPADPTFISISENDSKDASIVLTWQTVYDYRETKENQRT